MEQSWLAEQRTSAYKWVFQRVVELTCARATLVWNENLYSPECPSFLSNLGWLMTTNSNNIIFVVLIVTSRLVYFHLLVGVDQKDRHLYLELILDPQHQKGAATSLSGYRRKLIS